jgi:sec-independent protein translocase protein TatC
MGERREDTEVVEGEGGRMTFLEHLQELRVRLRNAGVVFLVATIVSAFWAWDFFQLLARPVIAALVALGEPPVIIKTAPAEGFWVQLKLALVLGIAAALPLIFWELWKFVAPGLYRREKKLALAFTAATVICFAAGAAFGYTLLSKTTHLFLLGSGVQVPLPGETGAIVKNMLTMDAMVNFQITMLLGTGVAFELPVVLGLLGWLGLINARAMWRFNRYALVLAVVAGAVLTPGADAYSQVILAGPLFLLYNLSIGLVWLIQRRQASVTDSPLLVLLAAWTAARGTARLRAAA